MLFKIDAYSYEQVPRLGISIKPRLLPGRLFYAHFLQRDPATVNESFFCTFALPL